jgi:hypothetical protein
MVARQPMEGTMQAILNTVTFWQQPKPVLKSGNPFLVPDRSARSVMQRTAEQIDVARRYWACPF